MSKVLFDEMDIPWHEWTANVVNAWAYSNGKASGLGPFYAQANIKVGHYIFYCGDEDSFYIMCDSHAESIIITYAWCDGHTTICDSIMLHKQEIAEGNNTMLESTLWHLVSKSGSFVKEKEYG